jgi:hypothetical protein
MVPFGLARPWKPNGENKPRSMFSKRDCTPTPCEPRNLEPAMFTYLLNLPKLFRSSKISSCCYQLYRRYFCTQIKSLFSFTTQGLILRKN